MTDIYKADSSSRYWRYQAVRIDYPAYPDNPEYLIIEICLSRADDRLCSWSAEPASKRPSGDTYAELLDDLMRMLQDAREWKPVAFDDLRVDMQFERVEVNDTTRRDSNRASDMQHPVRVPRSGSCENFADCVSII